jgi:hypothetical protein
MVSSMWPLGCAPDNRLWRPITLIAAMIALAALLVAPAPIIATEVASDALAAEAAEAAPVAACADAVDLTAEEAAGGHTIAKHIGKTEAELRLRLSQEPRITAASSFRNLTEAEQFVSQALQRNSVAIEGWAQTARAGDVRAFVYNAGKAVGQGVVRSTGKMQTMTSLRVVLQKTQIANKIYFVLTTYPIP